MASEKHDPTFSGRFVGPVLMIIVVSSFVCGGIMLGVLPGHERLGIVLFCAVLVVMITILAVLQRRVMGHYRCPQWQNELPRQQDDSGQPSISFIAGTVMFYGKPACTGVVSDGGDFQIENTKIDVAIVWSLK